MPVGLPGLVPVGLPGLVPVGLVPVGLPGLSAWCLSACPACPAIEHCCSAA
jgi:hypothetical protein